MLSCLQANPFQGNVPLQNCPDLQLPQSGNLAWNYQVSISTARLLSVNKCLFLLAYTVSFVSVKCVSFLLLFIERKCEWFLSHCLNTSHITSFAVMPRLISCSGNGVVFSSKKKAISIQALLSNRKPQRLVLLQSQWNKLINKWPNLTDYETCYILVPLCFLNLIVLSGEQEVGMYVHRW